MDEPSLCKTPTSPASEHLPRLLVKPGDLPKKTDIFPSTRLLLHSDRVTAAAAAAAAAAANGDEDFYRRSDRRIL